MKSSKAKEIGNFAVRTTTINRDSMVPLIRSITDKKLIYTTLLTDFPFLYKIV